MSEIGTVTISTEEYLNLVQKASNNDMFLNKFESQVRENTFIIQRVNDLERKIFELERKIKQ